LISSAIYPFKRDRKKPRSHKHTMEPRSQTLFFKEIYEAKPEPHKSGSNDSGFYKITRAVSVNSSTSTPPLAILIYLFI